MFEVSFQSTLTDLLVRLFFEKDIKGDLIWMMTNIRMPSKLQLELSSLTTGSSILASVWQRTWRYKPVDPALRAAWHRQDDSLSGFGPKDLDTTEHGL
jgi:hypothetical protein